MKKKCNVMSNLKLDTNEIFLKMKLLTLMLFAAFVSASASSYSQATKFNLDLKNVSISDVFQKIEEQSEFVILFNEKTFDIKRKVDIAVRDETVDKILDQVFEGEKDAYKIFDRQIAIYPNEIIELPTIIKSETNAEQQKKTLSGIVKDSKGLPIPGVTVIAKATTIGTITDADGQFILSVPTDAKTLVFSFIGMKTQEIQIGGKTSLNVVLEEMTVSLEEVVAVGYGTQKKASVVGAISAVSGKDIMKTGGVSSLSMALTGALPGLNTIQSNTGQPGSENVKLIIRSVSSWNGSDPLVLVDGIKRSMDDIDPNDVDNISILKDASATSVYGVEGANGVILITTKRGKSGKTKLTFSGNITMKTISRLPEVLDSYQGLSLKNQAIMNEVAMNPGSWANYTPQEVLNHFRDGDNPYIYPNNNWRDYFTSKPGYSRKAGFTMSGGTDFVKYFGSMNYLHESDIFSRPDAGRGYDPSYSYNRFNFRTNLDFKLTRSTSFSVNLAGYRGSQKKPNGDVAQYLFKFIAGGAPDLPIKYEDGIWGSTKLFSGGVNSEVQYNYTGISISNTTNFTTDMELEQNLDFITKGLKVDLQFSYDNSIASIGPNIADVGLAGVSKYIDPVKYAAAQTDAERNAATTWTIGPGIFTPVAGLPTISSESYNGSFNKQLVYQARLNYSRDFGKHAVSGLAVFKRQQVANGAAWPSYREDWVGRATYGYNNRYLFEANGAYNGSEKFGPGYRFGFFPSVSLGWTFSNEKFIKDRLPFLSMGKIRYSNGSVGSDAGIPRWLYDNKWSEGSGFVHGSTGLDGYMLGYPFLSTNPSYQYYNQSVIGNANARWETAHKQNLGLETSFFNNLITLIVDHYWEKRTGIFMSGAQRTSVPNWFGAKPVAVNLGETEGKGWEVELKFNKTTGKGLHHYANISWALNKDKIIYMEDGQLQDDYLKRKGFIIGQTKSRLNNGFYNSWDDLYTSVLDGTTQNFIPGQFKQIDFNADGKVDDFDAAPYGYANHPQGTYNATLGADYKGFSVMLQFYGVYNITRLVSMNEFPLDNGGNYWTVIRGFNRDDAWTPERAANGTASYSALAYRVKTANQGNYLYKDASYFRLKTAEIAYTLDKSVLTRLGVAKTRIFLNGNNLIFWSKLLQDVEGSPSMTPTLTSLYPTLKRYNLGVEITF